MKKTYSLFFLALFQSITFNLAHPITPSFISELGFSNSLFGIFFAAMSLGIVIGAPIWGYLSDKDHPYKFMILGSVVYIFGQLGFGFFGSVIPMVLSRFFAGLGASSLVTIIPALLIQSSSNSEKPKVLSYLGGIIIFGSSLGYYLGGLLSYFKTSLNFDTYQYVFLVQIFILILYILLLKIILSPMNNFKMNIKNSWLDSYKILSKLKTNQILFFYSLMLATMSFTFMSKFLDVHFISQGYSPNHLGFYVLMTGLFSIFSFIYIIPYFLKFNKMKLLVSSLIVSAISIIVTFSFSPFIVLIYSIYLFFILARSTYQPTEQLTISSFEGFTVGELMGIRQFFIGIGMFLGPILGGYLYDQSSIFSFYFNALLLLFSSLLAYFSLKKK